MKVTGETFSFLQKEKKTRRGKMPQASKLLSKKTEQESNIIIFLLCLFCLLKGF
jgi:hypothetical protein